MSYEINCADLLNRCLGQGCLEALLEQTSAITANLKAIDEDDGLSFDDLEELERQTNLITRNLKVIEDSDVSNLDELVEQTNNIAANLKFIAEEA